METETEAELKGMAGFCGMVCKPRETMGHLLAGDNRFGAVVNAGLFGMNMALGAAWFYKAGSGGLDWFAYTEGNGFELWEILLAADIVGGVWGILVLCVLSFVLWVVMGGKAGFGKVLTVVGWSFVPFNFSLLLFVPMLLIYGDRVFNGVGGSFDQLPTVDVVVLLGVRAICLWWSLGLLAMGLMRVIKLKRDRGDDV